MDLSPREGPASVSVSMFPAGPASRGSLHTALKQLRQVRSRGALRALAPRPALLGASHARRQPRPPHLCCSRRCFVARKPAGGSRGRRCPAGRCGRRRAAQGRVGARAARASSSDSPQLFERRERSERSEFCGATPAEQRSGVGAQRRPPASAPPAGRRLPRRSRPRRRRDEMKTAASKRNPRQIALYAIAGVGLAVWAFPVIWGLLTSFKTERDVLAYPPKFIFEPTLANYREVIFGASSIVPNIWSSVVVATLRDAADDAVRGARRLCAGAAALSRPSAHRASTCWRRRCCRRSA